MAYTFFSLKYFSVDSTHFWHIISDVMKDCETLGQDQTMRTNSFILLYSLFNDRKQTTVPIKWLKILKQTKCPITQGGLFQSLWRTVAPRPPTGGGGEQLRGKGEPGGKKRAPKLGPWTSCSPPETVSEARLNRAYLQMLRKQYLVSITPSLFTAGAQCPQLSPAQVCLWSDSESISEALLHTHKTTEH